jgi:prepilin-type N-terminal cleavage/methylation domain-containing protein
MLNNIYPINIKSLFHKMPNSTKKTKSGFSIFELSIVILIFGLLVVGATKGGEMVRKSKVIAAASTTKSSIVGKIDGLVLWLETTMPDSFNNYEAADGIQVSTWYDISNSKTTAVNAVQATTSRQPTYTSNGINGLPALKFVAYGFDNNADTFTLFLVWQPTLDPSLEMNLLEKWTGSSGYPYKLISKSKYTLAAYDGSLNPGVISSTSRQYGITHLVTGRKIKKDSIQMWVNGVSEGGTVTDTTNNSSNTSPLFIGSRNNDANFMDGYIGEIIIFDRALSDQEIEDVETYLGTKWSITIS